MRIMSKQKLKKIIYYILFLIMWKLTSIGKGKYKEKNLILFRLDLIGDCTMFTSVVQDIINHYKGYRFTVVCLKQTEPIFKRLGVFDNIISLNCRPDNYSFRQLFRMIKAVNRSSYDLLLQPQVSKLPLADILAASVCCNKRICIKPLPGNSTEKWIKYVNPLYDMLIPYPEGWHNEFEYYSWFIKGLGLSDYKIGKSFLPVKKQKWISGRYYVLYPGASWTQRAWNPEKFADIINYMFPKTGYTCVILGTSSEQWIANKILENVALFPKMSIINLIGKTSLYDVIDIIGGAEFVLSNDTSGGHIAAATNTPSVVIVGGGHLNRFFPYKLEKVEVEDNLPIAVHTQMDCFYCDWNWEIIRRNNASCLEDICNNRTIACVKDISTQKVINEIKNLIESSD